MAALRRAVESMVVTEEVIRNRCFAEAAFVFLNSVLSTASVGLVEVVLTIVITVLLRRTGESCQAATVVDANWLAQSC